MLSKNADKNTAKAFIVQKTASSGCQKTFCIIFTASTPLTKQKKQFTSWVHIVKDLPGAPLKVLISVEWEASSSSKRR